MLFTEPAFLFVFLPVLLGLYVLVPRTLQNLLLLTASLVFYAWGEAFYIWVMCCSIVFNYICAIAIENRAKKQGTRWLIATAVVGNLLLLIYFKYASLIIQMVSQLATESAIDLANWSDIHLPIGISFFTFQAISYVVDVYRGRVACQRNPINAALYIAMFPQLIAGPIVRYEQFARQLRCRRVTSYSFASGVHRFIIGLSKKLIIANGVAGTADRIFSLQMNDLSMPIAWLGLVCYTIQIYFDFSGYSDMAVGLGRMFGFRFPINFRYPYISRSVTEFWHRWHISLSTWFRDYLYIPLGGNRVSSKRTYVNLVIVFALCGFWHGAQWTFLLWGLYHGLFLVVERIVSPQRMKQLPKLVGLAYTLLTVMGGWVLFRCESFEQTATFGAALLGMTSHATSNVHLSEFATRQTVVMILLAVVAATPVYPWVVWQLRRRRVAATAAFPRRISLLQGVGHTAWLAVLLFLCFVFVAAETYNPFLYFRF